MLLVSGPLIRLPFRLLVTHELLNLFSRLSSSNSIVRDAFVKACGKGAANSYSIRVAELKFNLKNAMGKPVVVFSTRLVVSPAAS